MPQSILYPVRPELKRIRSYYKIRLNQIHSCSPQGPFLSEKAYEQIHKRGFISGVHEEGVLLKNERWVVPPSLFIRMRKIFDQKSPSSHPQAPQIFISQEELNGLADHFGVPPQVLNGSFFMRKDYRTMHSGVSVKPSWLELLNPEWRKALLKWRIGKGKLPAPSEFEWWVFLNRRLTLPALRQAFHFKPVQKKKIKGKLVLSQSGEFRYATFHYPRNRTVKYLIGPDEAKWVSRWNEDGENYNKESFLALLGSKPASRRYRFTKKAIERNMISLGNVDGTTFLLRFTVSVPLSEGNSYFIEVIRVDSFLKFKCYKSSRSRKPYAVGKIKLDEGLPKRWYVAMAPPPEA